MKNTVKKALCTFIAVIAAVSSTMIFTGCSNNGETGTSQNSTSNADKSASVASETEKPTQSKETIKIEDIDWNVDEGIVSGKKYVLLNYTNKSKFLINDFEITFKQKNSVTNEQKETFFSDVKKEFSFSDDDMKQLEGTDISMHAESNKLVDSGEMAKNINCYYYQGYSYVTNINHYNLVEPDIATIKYVGDDQKIYTVYYDFSSKKYSEEEDAEDAYYWTTTELGNKIPKPDVKIVKKYISDDEDSFGVEAFGVTSDYFNSYADKCKELGFTEDVSEYDTLYSAKDKDGYDLSISYSEDDDSMTITLDAPNN